MSTLDVFIDESGTFDFTSNGSRYFILTAVTTSGCGSVFPEFFEMKHAIGWEEFHATEDEQRTRNLVYDFLERHCGHGCLRIDSVIAQKNKVPPTLREEAVFYARLLRVLLRLVFRQRTLVGVDRINVWAARIGTKRKKHVFEKAIKTYLARTLDRGIPYRLLIHSAASHPLLQMADYCCWAVAKKWKDKELRPYNKIRSALQTELDVLRRGRTEYY